MSRKIAVIQFPGSNCERETVNAIQQIGGHAEIIRWNTSYQEFNAFNAYVLPGGFSYQDRIRAGVIASKLPIMEFLLEASKAKKPILGICNGCQILAESGLVPNISGNHKIEMALDHNECNDEKIGFICDWQYVRLKNPKNCIFTREFDDNTVLPIPINHGEGKFIFKTKSLDVFSEHTLLQYVSPETDVNDTATTVFPINPNASQWNIAGISNAQGNVFALMPHPERAYLLKQVPLSLEDHWAKQKQKAQSLQELGPWAPLFSSVWNALIKETV